MILGVEDFVTVFFVACHGVAEVGEMSADLVRLAAVQPHFDERIFAMIFQHAVFREDLFRTRNGLRKDLDAGGAFVFEKIGRADGALAAEGMEADRLVHLFGAALAEGIEQLSFRRGCQRKAHHAAGISVQTVQKTRAAQAKKVLGKRFRIDARKFIRYEDVFVAVDLAVEHALLFFHSGIIYDLIAGSERHVFPHPNAVDAYVAAAEQSAEGKGALRVMLIGEIP